jgi:hypothetical protein
MNNSKISIQLLIEDHMLEQQVLENEVLKNIFGQKL